MVRTRFYPRSPMTLCDKGKQIKDAGNPGLEPRRQIGNPVHHFIASQATTPVVATSNSPNATRTVSTTSRRSVANRPPGPAPSYARYFTLGHSSSSETRTRTRGEEFHDAAAKRDPINPADNDGRGVAVAPCVPPGNVPFYFRVISTELPGWHPTSSAAGPWLTEISR